MSSPDRDAHPRVTAHFAQTIDGRIALEGAPALLSTDEGTTRAHRSRTEHDAVLVGARTLATDDPLLTVRACSGPNPMRVVLSSTLAVPSSARLFRSEGGRVVVIGAEGRASREARAWLEARGADVFSVTPCPAGWVSLPHALRELRARGVERLLVEGGARVLTSFLRDKLVDHIQIEIATRLLGDPSLPALGALGITSLRGAIRIANARVEPAGENFLLRGDVVYP